MTLDNSYMLNNFGYMMNNPFLNCFQSFNAYSNPFMSCFSFSGDIPSLGLFTGMNYGSYTNFMSFMPIQFSNMSINSHSLPICPSIYDAYNSFIADGKYYMPLRIQGSVPRFQFTVPSGVTSSYAQQPAAATSSLRSSSRGIAASSRIGSGYSTVKKYDKDLSADFISKAKLVAKNVGCNYDDLLSIMNSESGLNPQAQNGSSGAVGLIQFTGVAIQSMNKRYGLNLTKDKIKNMTAVEQLDLVEKYINMAKGSVFSAGAKLSGADLYSLIFLPGRAARDTLTQRGEAYYSANKGLDINNDGKITKSDLTQRVNSKKITLVA